MRRFLSLPTRYPASVLIVALAITALAISRLVDLRTGEVSLRVDSSVDQLLPEGDEAREFFEHISDLFPSSETLIVALVMDDVFTRENLAAVKRVSEILEEMEGVDYVVSLATAENILSADDEIVVEPFLQDVPEAPDEIERIRDEVRHNPIYAGNLVSHDFRATAVAVYLDDDLSEQELIDEELDLRILEAATRAGGGAEVWISGPPRIKAATARLIFSGLGVVLPLAILIMAVVGALAFRTVLGVVVPIVAIVIAILWTLGVVAWLEVPLNLVTTIVPPLLMSLGFAYAIHVVSDYYQAQREDPERVAQSGGPAAWALQHVALPVALTAATTMAGFLSLILSPFTAVREFGLISVLGVFLTALVSLTLIPALLQLFGRPRGPGSHTPETRGLDRPLERLGRFVVRYRAAVFFACAAVALVAAAGTARIRINSDLVSNFDPDNSVRRHFEAINRSLEGGNPFEIVIEADEVDTFAEPANLRVIAALQDWLRQQPEIGGSTSLADYVKLLHRSFRDGDPRYLSIPESTRLIKQLLLVGPTDELSNYVDPPSQTANIRVRSRIADSQEMAELIDRIEARLATLPNHLRARATGNVVLLTRAMDDIARGQIQTLSVAFIFIYVILAGLFTSLRVGVYALLPNVLPVMVYFGALGLWGIGLNTTTGLFACMILGIAVDDTIHFLTRFNVEARERADEKVGAVSTLRVVGRPVTITTVALCLGFLTLTTSELKNQVEFGALGAFTLAIAWLIDVTFTPALCSRMRIVTLWDLLTFDLGDDPQRSIPVLRGLSKAQARIVALMTRVQTFPAGAPVFRIGEPGEELYVVIDGEMLVSLPSPSGPIELARLRRGDVVGEIGVYHESKRTADVDAVTDLRVLRLTKENLMRLRNRYPRIGSRVFWNLSQILAGRLAGMIERAT